jgi:hypothetical protein
VHILLQNTVYRRAIFMLLSKNRTAFANNPGERNIVYPYYVFYTVSFPYIYSVPNSTCTVHLDCTKYFIKNTCTHSSSYTTFLFLPFLKGHGNEADFQRFLHKSVRHRSLTLHFEPFRFWLRICGDIRNRKTTPRVGESPTL